VLLGRDRAKQKIAKPVCIGRINASKVEAIILPMKRLFALILRNPIKLLLWARR